MFQKMKVATLVATAVLLVGCSDSDNNSGGSAQMRSVNAVFADLDVLGDDYLYEGWLITPSGAVSAGRFQSSGENTAFSFDVSTDVASVATAYVLTIEPAEDDEPEPAATHVLAGDLIADAATLTIAHPAALGQDFTGATGVFGMAVPSDESGSASFRNGIWWLQNPPTAEAGLTLPELPNGWVYEGWVAGADGPVSTGRFTAVDAADSDGAGETGGTNAAPPFPGQDFIKPQLVDLIGMAAVISVEPEPDNAAGPFVIKPLIDAEIENVGALPVTQLMALVISDHQPSGSIALQ